MSRYTILILILLAASSTQRNLQHKFKPQAQIEIAGMTLFGTFFVSNSILTLIQMVRLGNFSREQIEFIKDTIKLRDELNKNMVSNCTSASTLVESNLLIYLELEKSLLSIDRHLAQECSEEDSNRRAAFDENIAKLEDIFYKDAYKKAFGNRDLALEIENSEPINKMKARKVLSALTVSNDGLIRKIIERTDEEDKLDCENLRIANKMSNDLRKNVRYTISSNLMIADRICEDSAVKVKLNADMERTYQMMEAQESEMRNSDSFIYELFGNKSNEELSKIARDSIDSTNPSTLEDALLDYEMLKSTYKFGDNKRRTNGLLLTLILLENSMDISGVLSKGGIITHIKESISTTQLIKFIKDHADGIDKTELGAQIAKHGRNYALNARDYISYNGILKYAKVVPLGNMLFKAYESFWKWSKTNFYINVARSDMQFRRDNQTILVFQETKLRNFRLVDLQYETSVFGSSIASLSEMTIKQKIKFDGSLIDRHILDSFCGLNAFYCYSSGMPEEVRSQMEDRLFQRYYSDIKMVYRIQGVKTLMSLGYELIHIYSDSKKHRIEDVEFSLGSTFLMSCRGCRKDATKVVYFTRDTKKIKDKGEALFNNFLYKQLDADYRKNCSDEPQSLKLKRIVAKSEIKTLFYLDYYVHYFRMKDSDIKYYEKFVECVSQPNSFRKDEQVKIKLNQNYPLDEDNQIQELNQNQLMRKEEGLFKAEMAFSYVFIPNEIFESLSIFIDEVYTVYSAQALDKDNMLLMHSKQSTMPAKYQQQIIESKEHFCTNLDKYLETTTAHLVLDKETKTALFSSLENLTGIKYFEAGIGLYAVRQYNVTAGKFDSLFYNRTTGKEGMTDIDVLTTYYNIVLSEANYTYSENKILLKHLPEFKPKDLFLPILDKSNKAHFIYRLLSPELNVFEDLSKKAEEFDKLPKTLFTKRSNLNASLMQAHLYTENELQAIPSRGKKFEVFDLFTFTPKSKTGISFYRYGNEEKEIGFATVESLKKVDYAIIFAEIGFPQRDNNNDYQLVFTQNKVELEQIDNPDFDQVVSNSVVAEIVWKNANGSKNPQVELNRLKGGLAKKFYSKDWIKISKSNDMAVSSVNIELNDGDSDEPYGFLEVNFYKQEKLEDLSSKYKTYCDQYFKAVC